MQPVEPPYRIESTGIGGIIGSAPEDFRVTEVPAYSFEGKGEHLYLKAQKRNLTTRDAEHMLASHFGVSRRDVGYAGMKDKQAITRQWFSLPVADDVEPFVINEQLEVVETDRHRNKLRRGHLNGNHFEITLHRCDGADDEVKRIADAIRERGIFNSFGHQRFGYEGSNLADALAWAEEGGRLSSFKRKLYTSVIQSEVFNRYLHVRRDNQPELGVCVGDVMRLDGTNSVFVSEEPAVDEKRREEDDIHLTGPIFGPKAKAANSQPLAWEEQAISALQLSEEAMARLAKNGAGTRRDILLQIPDLEWERSAEGQLVVRFFLPSGAYATQVIREFIRTPWLSRMRESEDNEELLDEE
jgi:tRNA pseudouridine13 synthase